MSSSEEEYEQLANDSLFDNVTNEQKSQKGVTAVESVVKSLSSKSEQFNEVMLDESDDEV